VPDHGDGALLTAELLSVGSELTVGETVDTNSNALARELAAVGVRVLRITAVPDDLGLVTTAFTEAIERADLVISTGGLGPTPDDLTREAIAAVCGETPTVDPALERWLRELWERRGMPFPELNLKQAWLIPSSTVLRNPNGTAPGWFVDRSDGTIVIAMPGPPREMRPMWTDEVLPRLRERGLGRPIATRTLRLAGIGESQVAATLGEALLRATNPTVATYARAEAVDIRISAVDADGQTGPDLVADAEARVLAALGDHVWARGTTSWAEAIGVELERLGWSMSVVEIGTGGSVGRLLGDRPWLDRVESLAPDGPAPSAPPPGASDADEAPERSGLVAYARRGRELGGSALGVAVRARPRAGDTAVTTAVASPYGDHTERRLVFLDGELGRSRAALAGAAVLLAHLRTIQAEEAAPVAEQPIAVPR
jgi:nicotinamide-nucleotide amidase